MSAIMSSMKIDLAALTKKKSELKAAFDAEKAKAAGCEQTIEKATEQLKNHMEEMNRLQGAFRTVDELIVSAGGKSELPANSGNRHDRRAANAIERKAGKKGK